MRVKVASDVVAWALPGVAFIRSRSGERSPSPSSNAATPGNAPGDKGNEPVSVSASAPGKVEPATSTKGNAR